MTNWKDVPLPKCMQELQKDVRGYPVPFIVMRDTGGTPHFAVNDSMRVRRCLDERRCPVCGNRLGLELWFVGGPLSAFHEYGGYRDTAMHRECSEYALKVCPYLGIGSYLKRIDTAGIDPDKLPDGIVFVDLTQIPERPVLFVAVMATEQEIRLTEAFAFCRPIRPYVEIQYWRNGERLEEADAHPLVEKTFADVEQMEMYRAPYIPERSKPGRSDAVWEPLLKTNSE